MTERYQNPKQRRALMVGLSAGIAIGFGLGIALTALARLMGL